MTTTPQLPVKYSLSWSKEKSKTCKYCQRPRVVFCKRHSPRVTMTKITYKLCTTPHAKLCYEVSFNDFGIMYVVAENSIEAINIVKKSYEHEHNENLLDGEIKQIKLLGKAVYAE
jgi:hypothetical protein